jgi:N-acetylglucosaminyldiphosphoundecaprenol N-acetyl-beta-D-mannosaminyltransferase
MHRKYKFWNGLPFSACSYKQAIDSILNLSKTPHLAPSMVFTPNVHHYYLYSTNATFRNAYNCATLSLLDGMPLVWLSNLLFQNKFDKISGSDIFMDLLKYGLNFRYRIYLLGGAAGVAKKALENLGISHLTSQLIFINSPPIGFEDDKDFNQTIISEINSIKPNILFVALGAPKQEIWIHKNHQKLVAGVTIGVGGSIDFVAGITQRAPLWVQQHALEWLYRLIREPGRLWKRYLITNTFFCIDIIKSFLFKFNRP